MHDGLQVQLIAISAYHLTCWVILYRIYYTTVITSIDLKIYCNNYNSFPEFLTLNLCFSLCGLFQRCILFRNPCLMLKAIYYNKLGGTYA